MSNMVVYNDGEIELKVSVDEETVWLNRNQISDLFERDVKTIGKHINNVFDDGELEKVSVVANFATTAELASSNSSFRALLTCFPIVLTSLSNRTAIWLLLSHTVSPSVSTSSFMTPSEDS